MSTEARIPSPIEVIETFEDAANHGDVVNMLTIFADDATITYQPALPPFQPVYQGEEQIRNYLRNLITKDFHVDSRNMHVSGNEVTWESTITADPLRKEGIDQAQVTNHAELWGALIHSLTVTPKPQMQKKAQAGKAAQGKTQASKGTQAKAQRK